MTLLSEFSPFSILKFSSDYLGVKPILLERERERERERRTRR